MADALGEAVFFQPRHLPVDEILAPIAGESPAGEDLSLKPLRPDEAEGRGLYDQLKEAARADDPRLLGGDTYKPKEGWKVSDWDEVGEIALECLTTRSKDFRAGSYLALSLAERYKLTGMAEGIWLLAELQERFWDHLHPLPDKIRNPSGDGKIVDPVPRAQDLERVLSRYAAMMTDEALLPACDENEDDQKIGKVLRRVDNLATQIDRLDAVIEARYYRWGPSLRSLREPLQKYRRSFQQVLDTRTRASEEAAAVEIRQREQAERRAAEETRKRAAEEEARAEQLKELGIDHGASADALLLDSSDSVSGIATLACRMRRAQPENPAAYRLTFVAAWSSPDEGGADAPPDTAREGLARLAKEKAWDSLVDGSITAAAKPWGRRWLDPAFYVAMALEAKGERGARALEALKAEVRLQLSAKPGLVEATFSDGTAVASVETREWLGAILAACKPADEAEATGLPAKSVAQAEQLWSMGQVPEAVQLLKQVADSGASERERFLMRLGVAELCLERGVGIVADPLIRSLMETIDQRELQHWENPRILGRVYNVLYRLAQSGDCSEEAQSLSTQAFERLCILDPGKALKLR